MDAEDVSASIARMLGAEHLDGSSSARLGVDVVDIEQFSRQLNGRAGDRFAERVFTFAEIEDCRGRPEKFATRWAIKECVAKAIGTGFRQGLRPGDVEVVTLPSGRPLVRPTEGSTWPLNAARWNWEVSSSHEKGLALAVAVARILNAGGIDSHQFESGEVS